MISVKYAEFTACPVSGRFPRNGKSGLAPMGETINSGLASALVASLSEAAREPKSLISCDSAGSYIRGVGRLLLAADGRSVALFGAETAPNRVRGKGRGRTEGQLSLSLGEKTPPSQL